MPVAPTYSPSDLVLFTHVLDRIAIESGGLDEATRARVGLWITMGAAAGIRSVSDLVDYARTALPARRDLAGHGTAI